MTLDKKYVDYLRSIPLTVILADFDATPDPKDPHRNYRHNKGRITITNQMFYNHDLATGGSGAIDLTMHLGELSFLQAKEHLEKVFPDKGYIEKAIMFSKAEPKNVNKSSPSIVPLSCEQHLGAIVNYLVNERKISQNLVTNHIEKKDIWADNNKNVVFALKDAGNNIVGAELRGTYKEKPFHGTRGAKSNSFFKTEKGQHKHICFVESSIDALSYKSLFPKSCAYASAGSRVYEIVSTAKKYLDAGFSIGLGFDADQAGDKLATNILEKLQDHPKSSLIFREIPKNLHRGKDWNDSLKNVLQTPDRNKKNEEKINVNERQFL